MKNTGGLFLVMRQAKSVFYKGEAACAVRFAAHDGYAVGNAFAAAVEYAVGVAADLGVYRIVRGHEVAGSLKLHTALFLVRTVGRAIGALADANLFAYAAVALVEAAAFKSAFQILHYRSSISGFIVKNIMRGLASFIQTATELIKCPCLYRVRRLDNRGCLGI